MFFALAHQLGFPADLVKERAKQHFGLASFNDITTEQLRELIDRLVTLQAQRENQSAVDDPAQQGQRREHT
jgi:hypothetical protein